MTPLRPSSVSEKPIPLDERLCVTVHSTARAFDALYRRLLAPTGLTYPQYLVMSSLWQHGPQSPGELAGALHLDPSSITALVRRLLDHELIERRRDPHDDRRVLISLTDHGRAVEADTAHVLPAVCAAIAGSTDHQPALLRDLTELASHLHSAQLVASDNR